MNVLMIIDGSGIYGSLLHYAMVLFFVGSALLIFTYLWWTGKLGMSEGPKYRMMDDEENNEENHHERRK